MRIKFFKSINSYIAIVLAIIVVTTLVFGGIFVYGLSSSLKGNSDQNAQIEKANTSLIYTINLKIKFSQVVKDVNLASLNLYTYVVSNEFRYESEIMKMWDKSIIPNLNKVESEIENLDNDELKVRFNILYDQIIYMKNLHEDILKAPMGADVSDRLNLLNESILKISTNYDSFISVVDKVSLDKYNDIDLLQGYNRSILIICVFILLASSVLAYFLLKSTIKTNVKSLEDHVVELKKGNVPDDLYMDFIELKKLVRAINFLTRKISLIRDFAIQVGEGNFRAESIDFQNEGELGNALNVMKERIIKVDEEDDKRNRINEGLAKFSEILGNYSNNLQKFGDEVIVNLVKFLNSNQGCLFVVNDENMDDEHLQLVSTYANNKKKFQSSRIIKGQGLVGQAWIEGKTIYMTKVPKNYINITSGLGYSTPRSVLIIPLKFNEEIHGVIELASFNTLEEYELDFVSKVSENIASALASVKINSRTQDLLIQYEDLAEKLKDQEEEMQSKVSELKQVQKEAKHLEESHISEIKRLKKRLEIYEKHF